MEIEYKDKNLKELCTAWSVAIRKLGNDCAKKLFARIADLEAVSHVKELLAGRPHPLKGDRDGQFSLSLSNGLRLVFEPNHDPIPVLENGGIDWANVTNITIIFIGDYHD